MSEARRLNKRLERSGPLGWHCWDGPWRTAPSRRGTVVWVRRYKDRYGRGYTWRIERLREYDPDAGSAVIILPPRLAGGREVTERWGWVSDDA